MHLLVKFPTRSRTRKFFKVLDRYYELLSNLAATTFVISVDEDDSAMNHPDVQERLARYHNLHAHFGPNQSKVEAINADLARYSHFDILLLASDDMIPVQQGYDDIIRNEMTSHFPDTDGVLHFNDGNQGPALNTLAILGKRYFDRFGYIYHPAYKSLWCDNEFMLVAQRLGKQVYLNDVIIRHGHPSIAGHRSDRLRVRNGRYGDIDRKTFEARQAAGFTATYSASLPIKSGAS